MPKLYPMILFSPLPCVPLLWLAISASWSKLPATGIETYQDVALISVTVLALLGCLGLVLAGLAIPQRQPKLTSFVRFCVVSGFAAVVVGVLAYFYGLWAFRHESPQYSTAEYWVLVILFGLLAWPIFAGFQFLAEKQRYR